MSPLTMLLIIGAICGVIGYICIREAKKPNKK